MKNYVIDTYENYKEEDRLTTNNARKIEFITTTRVFDEVIASKSKILDCAAGTGIYSFWLADKGHDVTDMSLFEDETFDIVLNMGPFYHLITEEKREKCFSECLRVLKKEDSLLLLIFQDIMYSNMLL